MAISIVSSAAASQLAAETPGAAWSFRAHHNGNHTTSDFVREYPALDDADTYIADEDDDDCYFWNGPGLGDASTSQGPRRLQWTVDESGENVTVVFGESRDAVFTLAKETIKLYRARVMQLVHKSFEEIDIFGDIIDLFWGQNKPLAALMKDKLCLDDSGLELFLGTFCLQKRYGFSMDDLYDDEDGRFKSNDLMPRDKYSATWALIECEGNGKAKQFWELFERALNDTLHDIHVFHALNLMIALDDDKKKAQVKSGGNMQGLNAHVHPDRTKGIVAHTAACPATLLALGVCWEKSGESSYQCYIRLVEDVFGSNCNLDRKTFYSDRGYWIQQLLEYILEHGGDVLGTVRRQYWYGLTFDQDIKAGDTRLKVDKAGPSSLITAKATIAGRTITGNAYRTGTNNVALSMSSIVHGHAWECVVIPTKVIASKLPDTLSPEEVFAAVCRPFGSSIDRDCEAEDEEGSSYLATLANVGKKVKHTTERQGYVEWHFARRFSITSTGAYHLLPICSRERDLEADEDWSAVMSYLDVKRGWGEEEAYDPWAEMREPSSAAPSDAAQEAIGNDEVGDEGEDNGDGDINAEGDSADRTADDATVPDRPHKVEVEAMLADAKDSTDRSVEYCKKLADEIRSGEHDLLLNELVLQMSGKSRCTEKKVKTARWLEEREERLFIFLSVDELKVKYREKNGPRIPTSLKKRDDFIEVLCGKKDAPTTRAAANAPTSPIEAVARVAFLKPIGSGPQRDLMRLGHKMEPIYGAEVLQKSRDGGIKLVDGKVLVLQHLFRVGLVQSIDRPYQKDSPDFFLIGTLDGEPITAAVEMKARCKTGTNDAERRRANYGDFSYVSCRDKDLRRHLLKRSEAVQCAHHASTLSVNYILLVTGDRVGTTGGVLVHYDDEFLSSYQKCIEDIYNASLKWAYVPAVPFPTEEIQSALSKMSVPMDMDSFKRAFCLWREMMKPEHLPLPACSRILPKQAAKWNPGKHASDTMTQDCQGVKAPIPATSPQSRAIDRMLTITMHQCWKGAQIFSTNKDVEKYCSLDSYRSAASNVVTFKKYLGGAGNAFLRRATAPSSSRFPSLRNGPISTSASAPATAPSVTPVRSSQDGSPNCSETVVVGGFVAKESRSSPKRSHLKRLRESNSSKDQHVAKRFKNCRGFFFFRTTEDGQSEGPGAQGRCIDCNETTNWYCAECRNFCCHDRMRKNENGAPLLRDNSTYVGRKKEGEDVRPILSITGIYSCAMNVHPRFVSRNMSEDGAEMCIPCSPDNLLSHM